MAKKEVLNNDLVTVRVGESVTDILDEASDTIEKTLDILENQAERVVTVTKNNPILLAGVALAAAGVGAFVAYKLTRKRLELQFEQELSEQIEASKEFYRRVNKEGVFESPESAVQALVPEEAVDALRQYQGRERPVPYNNPDSIVEVPEPKLVVNEQVVTTTNVFVQAQENDPRDWDYNAELADRELNPGVPYTISFEEFNENEPGHEQTTLTYYSDDDTLVDAMDKPVDAVERFVGQDNLSRFGDGSGDKNVVYVRNEKADMDFEIIRENGSYHKHLFGTEPEPTLQHSRRQGRRSWRADE